MKKSEIVSKIELGNLLAEYEDFLSFLRDDLDIKNISKTKLQKFMGTSMNSVLSYNDQCELYANMNRFRRIKNILEIKRDDLNRDTLKRMISGSADSDFYTDQADDAFFEFDFAQRLVKTPNYQSIKINTNSDIIFNDFLTIECKKIHSEKVNAFRDNIKKARSQIQESIITGTSTAGFIAIDLTCLVDHAAIREKTQDAFNLFFFGYKNLNQTDDQATQSTLHDKNFKSVVHGFAGGLLEFCFNSLYRKIEGGAHLESNILGIFFQCESFIPIDNESDVAIFQRFASYEINDSFCDCREGQETYNAVTKFFHSLPSGI